jgi:hypothetical protein
MSKDESQSNQWKRDLAHLTQLANSLSKRVDASELTIKDSPMADLKNMQKMLRGIAVDYLSKESFQDCKQIFERMKLWQDENFDINLRMSKF